MSRLTVLIALGLLHAPTCGPGRGNVSAEAAEPPSAVGPLLTLLKKGTLPPERLPAVAKMVCERGNPHDLAYVFQQAASETWPPELRRDALRWLRDAAETRKVVPEGDLAPLVTLLANDGDPPLLRDAIALAGAWKTPAAVAPLQNLAASPELSADLRLAAQQALIAYGGEVARRTIEAMLAADQPREVRLHGIAGLVPLDPSRAAEAAAVFLSQLAPTESPAPLLDPFLNQRGGADRLAAALEKHPPASDVALLALRHLYAVGRSDPALESLLSRLAGLQAEAPRLSPEEILELAALAEQQGDPARGEAVFRRADLACLRCHAVSQAGGQVGPDLSPVGASSPVDYLVKSLYDPDAQKKEAFLTRIVLTTDGQQYTGIVENRTDEKLTLKLADGRRVDIPVADIDIESEGRSLMPEGLVKFMTRQEVLDLVKFLSMLGKPGTPYAIRQTQRMQRWRVLRQPSEPLLASVPNDELFADAVLRAGAWEPVYARVDGTLPLSELKARTGADVVYVAGEVNVTEPGRVLIVLDDWAGVQAWIDGDSLAAEGEPTVDLSAGRHQITLRVDAPQRASEVLRLEVRPAAGSKAQVSVVDGA